VTRFEVLVEGESDVPVIAEVLRRRFGLVEGVNFAIHPHHGKGKLPRDLLSKPDRRHRGLLDQLPAKLRAYAYRSDEICVVVVLDTDRESCVELLTALRSMLARLPRRPQRVLFRLAIEETESWLIADIDAVASAYRRASLSRLRRIAPDAVVGAAEELGRALGYQARELTGALKRDWAARIAPHLDLEKPKSPSLCKLIEGVARELGSGTVETRGAAPR
jgi:hypothetical protein